MLSKKIVNIVGPIKNGTTLIGTLLDSHPKISSFPLEIKFIEHLNKVPKDELNSKYFKKRFLETSKIKYLLEKDNNHKELNLNIGVFSPPSNFNYNLFCENFYNQKIYNIEDFIIKIHESLDISLNIKPRDIIVIQDGNHLLKNNLIAFSEKKLNNPKFILIHRNPMDVYISFKNYSRNLKMWRNNILEFVDIFLNDYLTLIELKKKKLSNFHFINYKNLIINSDFEINNLCKFLEIEFDETLKNPTIFGNKWYSNSSSLEKNDKIFSKSLYDFNKELNDLEKTYIYLKFDKVFDTLYPEIFVHKKKLSFIKLFTQCLNEFTKNTTKDWKIYFKILIIIKNIMFKLLIKNV